MTQRYYVGKKSGSISPVGGTIASTFRPMPGGNEMKTIRGIAKDLLESIEGISRRDILEIITQNPDGFGERLFYDADREDRRRLAPLDLPGWPACECCGCGCVEQATTTDDGGVPVCEECSQYDVDDETGDVVCSKTEGVELEEITECCGAGGQSRTYYRIAPPEEPAPDPNGEWACYWSTAGDNSGVVARYSTEEKALQAVRAKDFPHPSDHTDYLCGYEVRHLGEDGFDGL